MSYSSRSSSNSKTRLRREILTSEWCSYCDDETVDGVEFPSFPKSLETQAGEDQRLVVPDMSSNF